MKRSGHIGVQLLVFAPIAFFLSSLGRVNLAMYGALGMVLLARWPDIDHKLPFIEHRGLTHTVLFAALTSLGTAAIGYVLVQDQMMVVFVGGVAYAAFIGFYAVIGHLAGDVLTYSGIQPFQPFLSTEYTLERTKYDNRLWNGGLLIGGAGIFTLAVFVGRFLYSLFSFAVPV